MKDNNLAVNARRFLTLYILIQPLIDVSISFFLIRLNISLTPGLVIRNLALTAGALYIFFTEKKHRWYLLTLMIYYLMHLTINLVYKNPINYFQELSYFSKYTFFIVALISIRHVLRNTGFMDDDDLLRTMSAVIALISVVIIVGWLTDTGIESYGSEKIGQTGWFFSGTKISAALAILFPVSILYALKSKRSLAYVLVPLSVAAMFITGTKTSYAGIVIGLTAAVMTTVIRAFTYKDDEYKKACGFLIFVLLLATAYTPFSPVYTNVKIHQSWNDHANTDIILNGRELKQDEIEDGFGDEGVLRKLFGLGYGGDYRDPDYIIPIERDFHELFYYYGYVGFIIMLALPARITYDIFRIRIKDVLNNKIEGIMLLASLGAGVGCSYIAGHVLFAPSVSLYLACVMSLLTIDRSEYT